MVQFIENTGDSIENAIIITGAANEDEGVASEYIYLSDKFGEQGRDWKLEKQLLLEKDQKQYDKMDLILYEGTKEIIYFDISEFYGKF